MEGGNLSAGGSDDNPSEVEFLLEREEGLKEQRSPYLSDDMEDSKSLEFEQPLPPGSIAGARGLCSGSAWALAFSGVDCFGPEVIEYVANLGMHTSSQSLDVKAEELQQQLLIETRNLKKTRNFYQKLIQQERKHKGDMEKIFHRSLDLLQFWLTDCKSVDFRKPSLVKTVENFLNTEVIPAYSQGEALLHALHSSHTSSTTTQGKGSLTGLYEDDSGCLYSSLEDPCRKWRIPRVVESSASMPKQKAFSISAGLPMPCHGSMMSSPSLQSEEQLPLSQKEYSPQHIAQQLTLLQQEIFQGCHPVHFLNSRIQGVRDKVLSPNKDVSGPNPTVGGRGVLVQEGAADSFLQRLLTHADSITNWISAEIVICDSVKSQAGLLTKYLWIGKHCYEWRNFATAMQVLGALENVIVRQLPAWKHLTSKVFEILEELRAVQVFLKSDDLCLMGGQRTQRKPTLPSAHILAMHVQQLEIGAFTLTTGAYKWNKLRSIAKVVSQVHAFQEILYPYKPDRDLQAYLHSRITRLANTDIHLLAADNDANFQQSNERQTQRIYSTLKRVKATFQ